VAVIVVNWAQKMYMKLIGADAMFFSGKKKLIAIGVLGCLLAAIIIYIFGIEIPTR
jgi:hypothetical protein